MTDFNDEFEKIANNTSFLPEDQIQFVNTIANYFKAFRETGLSVEDSLALLKFVLEISQMNK